MNKLGNGTLTPLYINKTNIFLYFFSKKKGGRKPIKEAFELNDFRSLYIKGMDLTKISNISLSSHTPLSLTPNPPPPLRIIG